MNEIDSQAAADAAHGCPGFLTALVLRCAQRDEAALMALMELLYVPVRARLEVATLSDTEADEAVGRAFVHIWRRAASYDVSRPGGVVDWLLDEAASTEEMTSVLAAS